MKHVKVHVQEVTREGWMKHVPNGREESETAREWDPRTHEERALPTAGGQVPSTTGAKSSRSNPVRQSSERVQMFQKMSQQRKVQNMMVRILSQGRV